MSPLALLLTFASLPAAPAAAQISTATIQGRVTDDTGVLPGATVTARETESGFAQEAVTGTDGSFTLPGLRPGTYDIRVVMDPFKPQSRRVEVLVGQSVTLDFRVTAAVTYTETVSVVGDTRLVDTRKSEISTNVTEEQLRYLPQNSRNFLNFAALAPGVRVSDNEFRKEFTSGALPSRSVNVFIDGVSFKNDNGSRPLGTLHEGEDHAKADLRTMAVGRLAGRPDRPEHGAVLRVLPGEPAGPRRQRDRRVGHQCPCGCPAACPHVRRGVRQPVP